MPNVQRWKCNVCEVEAQGKDLETWEEFELDVPWYSGSSLTRRHLCPECAALPLRDVFASLRIPAETTEESNK